MTEHPNLHLSPEERRYYGQLFSAADTDKIGVVTGEVAVKFFEKTRLPPTVLGEIWNIADTENRGLLTPPGFGMVLRLIGYAQAGRTVSFDLALQPGGPLPKFDGIAGPSTPSSPSGNLAGPLRPQTSGGVGAGPIRVPPLTPDKVNQYSSLFEESGAQNGNLSGDTAKQIFERAQLPNEILGRIWNLADTEQKGSLGLTEFIIAMHLLASYKNGSLRALPQILPAGLYEAAARRGVSRQNTGTRPSSDTVASAVPRQFSGASYQRPSSPLARPPQMGQQPAASPAGDGWAISPQEKAQFDQIYATIDTGNRGFITGEQAVGFFSNSRLPEDALAQIWDLADINSEGQLNRDEFAVAMYLIKQQRSKRDGREVLPQSLPPNLVPPSMRRQAPAPSQPTAPAFDNASNINAPKKASDDLFGLDALSSPSTPPLVSNPTGDPGSHKSTASKSLSSQGSPQASVFQQQSQPQQPQQSSVFKPFIPSSSFGQSMSKGQPQTTGQSTPRSQPSAMDDLLGDNDPEVSKKLTNETTELANLSNQVGTLTGQMQQVKSKRISTEQDLSQAQAQKRDFETRLGQLRGAYEQEIREVKALEEQLAASRNGLQKLQQEMAMTDGSHQDLQNQHRQIAEALAKDQQENAELKEKIRQTNEEVKALKPQLEKMILDARQQKGLVAINKKQLATNEAEREKLKNNLSESRREYDETAKELEESKRSLESQSINAKSAPATTPAVATPAIATPATVISPGGSSMNPFFRSRAPTGGSERGVSSPFAAQNVASPNHNAFDSFFGPPAISETPSAGPPPTSFGASTPSEPRGLVQEPMLTGQSIKSSEDLVIPTPTDSPPPSTIDTPQTIAGEPPAPPQSRQITSSYLPFRSGMQRSDSTSSSIKVVPPASRMGDRSEFDTPTDRGTSFSEASDTRAAARSFAGDTDTPIRHPPRSSSISATNSPSPLNKPNDSVQSSFEGGSPQQPIERSGPREIPGAFPGDATPPPRRQPTMSESSDEAFHPASTHPEMSSFTRNDPFSAIDEKAGTPVSTKQDFDDAFASFGTNGKAPEERAGDSAFGGFDESSAPKVQHEFPPIQEFGADDESDSDSDRGFDDDFTAVSPSHKAQGNKEMRPDLVNDSSHLTTGESKETSGSSQPSRLEFRENNLAAARPPLTSNDTDTSQLPTPGAQQSPPTYDQVASPPLAATGQRSNSTSFPAEYQGLLPSREDPTSPVTSAPIASTAGITSSMNGEKDASILGGSTTTEPGTFGQSFGSALSHIQSPMAPGASEAPFAYSHISSQPHAQAQTQPQAQQKPPVVPAKTAFDDFDDEFGDLSEAKEADDKIDDELTNSRKENFDEFNPIFDSPSASRSAQQQPSSSSNIADSSFHDFESSITGGKGYGPQQIVNQGPQQQSLLSNQPQSQSHDWDAIFAGLDTPQNNGVEPSPPANKQTFDDTSPKPAIFQQQTYAPPPGPPPAAITSTGTGLGVPTKPALARAVSSGTEHDDPILKRLTGMGYPREESLRALEKFDYNIDKVCTYSHSIAVCARLWESWGYGKKVVG